MIVCTLCCISELQITKRTATLLYVFQREFIQNKRLQSTDDIARLNLSENSANKEHVETLKPQLHHCRLTVKRKKKH